jgi:phage baseplate assembly protein W
MAEGLSVALPLAISPSDGAYAVHKDLKNVARQSLKMIILTGPGERCMSPNFGVGIRSFLFEQITAGTSNRIKSRVANQVSTYLPYIRLNDLQVSDYPDDNTINLKINYSVPSAGITDEFVFPISQ